MGLEGGGVEVGVVGVLGDSGGELESSGAGLEESTHIGLQETQFTVHASGQNLGQTCSRL